MLAGPRRSQLLAAPVQARSVECGPPAMAMSGVMTAGDTEQFDKSLIMKSGAHGRLTIAAGCAPVPFTGIVW